MDCADTIQYSDHIGIACYSWSSGSSLFLYHSELSRNSFQISQKIDSIRHDCLCLNTVLIPNDMCVCEGTRRLLVSCTSVLVTVVSAID
jgi:hypothetical protein